MPTRFKMLQWLQRSSLKSEDTTQNMTETYWVREDYEEEA